MSVFFAEETQPALTPMLRRLKNDAIDMLSNIYIRMTQHQEFILDEILSSITKCPYKDRDFRLRSGRGITMLSGLLLSLLQNSMAAFSLPLSSEEEPEIGAVCLRSFEELLTC